MRIAASLTNARKFTARFSYRVATWRQCFIRLKNRSTRLRSRNRYGLKKVSSRQLRREKIGHGANVDRCEGFVEQHESRILQQEPRKGRPLHPSAREQPDRASLEPFEGCGRNRFGDAGAMATLEAADGTDLAPKTHCDEIDQ